MFLSEPDTMKHYVTSSENHEIQTANTRLDETSLDMVTDQQTPTDTVRETGKHYSDHETSTRSHHETPWDIMKYL